MDAGIAQLIAGILLAIATIIAPLITVRLTARGSAGTSTANEPDLSVARFDFPKPTSGWNLVIIIAVGIALGAVAGVAAFNVVDVFYTLFGPEDMNPALASLDAGLTAALIFAGSMAIHANGGRPAAKLPNAMYFLIAGICAAGAGFVIALVGNTTWVLALGIPLEHQHLVLDSLDAAIASGAAGFCAAYGTLKFLEMLNAR